MAQMKEITLAVEINVPVKTKVQKNNSGVELEAVITTDVRKVTKFMNKVARLCGRYGYSVTMEDKREEL